MFLLSAVAGLPLRATTWIGITLAIVVGIAAVTRRNPGVEGDAKFQTPTGFERVLVSGFFLAVAGMLLWVIASAAGKPNGEVDAWAMWNVKARFLFRDFQFWKDVF